MRKWFCFIIILFSLTVGAQPPGKFHTSFGGYGHDIGYSIVQTFKGHYAITGSTSSFGNGNTDVYLAYVDSMGWPMWQKSYGGFNNDIGKSIIQLADSGFVIAGYTNSFGSGGYDVYVIRVDKSGNLVWQKTIGGMDWDFGNCVIEVSNGGFVICGNTYSYGNGKSDGFIAKLDLNGVFQWQKEYGGAEDDNFKSLIETTTNELALVGLTGSYGDPDGDGWFFKTDLLGDSITSKIHGYAKKDFWNDIAQRTTNSNFMLAGAMDVDLSDSTYAQIMEVDQNGVFLFEAHWSYHNMTDAQFHAITGLKNEPFFGLVRKQFNSTQNRKLEPMIMITAPVYDIPGGVSPYGSPEEDDLYDITRTRDKGFVCVGFTKGFSANLTDVYLVKIDSNYTSVTGGPSMVGINEVKHPTSDFFVYPTVTNSSIHLYAGESTNKIELRITDCLGNLLLSSEIRENENDIDLRNLNNGVYFITLSDKDRVKTFKIIKSN